MRRLFCRCSQAAKAINRRLESLNSLSLLVTRRAHSASCVFREDLQQVLSIPASAEAALTDATFVTAMTFQ